MARCKKRREGRLKDQLLYIQLILQIKPIVHSLGETSTLPLFNLKSSEQKGILA